MNVKMDIIVLDDGSYGSQGCETKQCSLTDWCMTKNKRSIHSCLFGIATTAWESRFEFSASACNAHTWDFWRVLVYVHQQL